MVVVEHFLGMGKIKVVFGILFPGQVTDLFLPVIDKLDIVEVGDNQVKYLKEKYQGKNVCTYKAYFEDFNSDKSYDLIFSATAFHWVKEEIGHKAVDP